MLICSVMFVTCQCDIHNKVNREKTVQKETLAWWRRSSTRHHQMHRLRNHIVLRKNSLSRENSRGRRNVQLSQFAGKKTVLEKFYDEVTKLSARHLFRAYFSFRGMKTGTGGETLYTFEKSPWLTAMPTRPRESIYTSGCPTATPMNVFSYGNVYCFL